MNLLTKTLIVLFVTNSIGFVKPHNYRMKRRQNLEPYVGKCSEFQLKLHDNNVYPASLLKWRVSYDELEQSESGQPVLKTCCFQTYGYCISSTFFKENCRPEPGFDDFIGQDIEKWRQKCIAKGYDPNPQSCQQYPQTLPEESYVYDSEQCEDLANYYPIITTKMTTTPQSSVQRLGFSVVVVFVSIFLLFKTEDYFK